MTDLERAEQKAENRAKIIAAQERLLAKAYARIERLRKCLEHISGMNVDAGVVAADGLRVDDSDD